jgi:protein-disulfide isomerase
MEDNKSTKNPYLIPGAIVVAGIIIAGAVFLSQSQIFTKSFQLPAPEPSLTAQEESLPGEINIDFEGWPVMGNPEAKVTMVEYSDFACPFCARFWQETLPAIKKDYVDTGRVRFVYKDFIVVGGDRAAEAAHCAQEQGKFWEYHDLLFSRQTSDRASWGDSQVHRGYAKELGLDATALIECFDSRRYREKVVNSTQEAIQNGGQGTPYFLINEVPIFGAEAYSKFQQVIDSLLAEQ